MNSLEKENENFWMSLNILITKPHVVNKRLWGSKILKTFYIKTKLDNWNEQLATYKLKPNINIDEFVNDLTQHVAIEVLNNETDYEIIFIELLPKSFISQHAFQMICINKLLKQATFYDITPAEQTVCPSSPYTFTLENSKIILKYDKTSDSSYIWLRDTVLSHLIKWKKECFKKIDNICNESLALVEMEKYYRTYNLLKTKYGRKMVEIWPESTDPLKFVYEDIAIATYLLLLWEHNREPQTFVDVGCGNGLLVYILSMEGHTGFGVDIRKRKIWDMYPKTIMLREYTVTPSSMDIFTEVMWVIGNHSDELTPWIPIFAAKSSYSCNFFLLPCCAYNLDGTKYNRKISSSSQYTEYMSFIKDICTKCGFNTQIDRLKIPSTKRICFVGESRNYKESVHKDHMAIVQCLVNDSIGSKDDAGSDSGSKTIYKTRDPVEKVRNCTQIDKNVIEAIVKRITTYLLEDLHDKSDQSWSKGKIAPLNELVEIIPLKYLKILKSECGGLQTLLRNNHNIFEVKHGLVQIRYPRTIDEMMKKRKNNNEQLKIKEKMCWFYENHPRGCPLESSLCSFSHHKT